jgi:hypothetical protein
LRRDVFQEYIDFDKIIHDVYLEDDYIVDLKEEGLTGRKIYLKDICQQFNFTYDEDDEDAVILPPKCLVTGRPIDFVYLKDEDIYDLDRFETDAHLLFKVRTGKGDPKTYKMFYNLYPELIFGGTYPEEITQDIATGKNDIVFAKATLFVYFIDLGRDDNFEEEWYVAWEKRLQDATDKFNKANKIIQIEALTIGGV